MKLFIFLSFLFYIFLVSDLYGQSIGEKLGRELRKGTETIKDVSKETYQKSKEIGRSVYERGKETWERTEQDRKTIIEQSKKEGKDFIKGWKEEDKKIKNRQK